MLVFLLVSVFLFSGNVLGAETAEEGSSYNNAVVIRYIGDYSQSIGQEYEYISKKFGMQGVNWEPMQVSLVYEGDKIYDVFNFKILPSGEEKTLYFDITEPYGEMEKQFR